MQASCSLQYLPWDVSCEKGLSEKVGGEVVAFAVQTVREIVAVSEAVSAIVAGEKVRERRLIIVVDIVVVSVSVFVWCVLVFLGVRCGIKKKAKVIRCCHLLFNPPPPKKQTNGPGAV